MVKTCIDAFWLCLFSMPNFDHAGTTSVHALFLGSKPLGLAVLSCLRKAAPSVNWTIVHPNDTQDARSALDNSMPTRE